jgi:phosphate transport system protein
MTRSVVAMLSKALNAYFAEDAAFAEEVRQSDVEVDQMYNSLFREFLTHMMEDPRNITACMHLHFIAKNIERVGDHATGIAEQVIYLVTGHFPDEDVPKAKTRQVCKHRTISLWHEYDEPHLSFYWSKMNPPSAKFWPII